MRLMPPVRAPHSPDILGTCTDGIGNLILMVWIMMTIVFQRCGNVGGKKVENLKWVLS